MAKAAIFGLTKFLARVGSMVWTLLDRGKVGAGFVSRR